VLQNPQGPQTHNLTIGGILRLLNMSQPVKFQMRHFPKNRYRKFRSGNAWWCHDSQTGKPSSLTTKCEAEAMALTIRGLSKT
jgi:hypothetical protein